MSGETFVTPKCRASYPHLFKPFQFKDSDKEPAYYVTMLFPKASTDLKPMYAFIIAARDAKWSKPEDHARLDPASFFRDGDTSGKPEYAGMWYIKASSTRKPVVMDQEVKQIEDIEHHRVYPGCWVRVAISTYAWTFAAKIGVKLNLEHVQLVGDDESFITRSDPNEVFAPIPVEAQEAMQNAGFNQGADALGAPGAPAQGEYVPPPTQAPPAGEAPWKP